MNTLNKIGKGEGGFRDCLMNCELRKKDPLTPNDPYRGRAAPLTS